MKRKAAYQKGRPYKKRAIKRVPSTKRLTKVKDWSPLYKGIPYAGVGNTKNIYLCLQDNLTTSMIIPAGLTNTVLQFNLNDLNNPLAAAGNEDIPGLLEWGLFYNNFRVLHVKLTTTFINTYSQPVIAAVAFRPMDADPLWSNWSNIKNIDSTSIPNQRVVLDASLGPRDQATLVVESSLASLLGDKKLYLSDIGYAGIMPKVNISAGGRINGVSPSLGLQGYNYLLTTSGIAAAGVTTVYTMTKLEFYVQLFGRKLVIQ